MDRPVPLHPDQSDDWRLTDANADERRVIELNDSLEVLDKLHAIFESTGKAAAAAEAVAFAARVRDCRNDFADHARQLRADARDAPRPELPRATTTRRAG